MDDKLLIVCSHGDRLVNRGQDVLFHEIALSQDPDRCAIAVQERPVFSQLLELDLGHGHERVDFMLGALEVLDAESVDSHDLDAGFVANLEYLRVWSIWQCTPWWCTYTSERLKTQVVPFYSLNVVISRKPPVAVHHEGNMLRNRPLLKRANEQLSQLSYGPCNGRRGCEPLVYAGIVQRAHGVNC